MTNTLPERSQEPADALEPFEVSFPSSYVIHERAEWNGHELLVPKRRIHLTNDDPPVDVYDTSGPQGCDVRGRVSRVPSGSRRAARRTSRATSARCTTPAAAS